MKFYKILGVVIFMTFFMALESRAQWTVTGSDIANNNTGNVNIGTAANAVGTPSAPTLFTLGTTAKPVWQRLYATSGGTGSSSGGWSFPGLQINGIGTYSSNAFFLGVNTEPWLGATYQTSGTAPAPGSESKIRVVSLLKVQPFLDQFNLLDVNNSTGTNLFHMDKDKSSFMTTFGVGVGIATPADKLHVSTGVIRVTGTDAVSDPGIASLRFGSNSTTNSWIQSSLSPLVLNPLANSPFVGIGSSAPADKLHLNNGILRVSGTDVAANSGTGNLRIGSNGTNYSWVQSNASPLVLNPLSTGSNNNYVAIGYDPIATPYVLPAGCNLAVKGKVICEELKVKTSTFWPDYVFGSEYKLMPLDSVANYITDNKHLPQVPSATEIEANGINTGEMSTLLMKKVEELTLYLIDQKKEIDLLKEKNNNLEKKIETLTK